MSAERDLDARAGEFVLGLADEAEMARMEQDMERDPAFARAVNSWRERLSGFDRLAEPLEPSADLWERIRESLAAKPVQQVIRAGAGRPSLWQSLSFWRGSAFVGALSCLLLALGLGLVLQSTAPTPVVIAVLEADDSTPGAIVEAFADGSILLRPLQPVDVPEDKTLQVWTLWDRAVGPVPLGILGSLERTRFERSGQPVPQDKQLYEITLEPKGGSPTGRPTGPILYKGLASSPL